MKCISFYSISVPESSWYTFLIVGVLSAIGALLSVIVFVFCLRKRYGVKNMGYFELLMKGKPAYINRGKDLKDQAAMIPYNSEREIPRTSFEIGDQIGSGNFGSVHKGKIKQLSSTRTKPEVAIKEISGHVGDQDIENFLYEIKIMGCVDPHLNLVSMVGSCTSELERSREVWLVLEFCDHGELKSFLINNMNKIKLGGASDDLNSRCLVRWSYDIAKGMQYLADSQIMHGDLAARNVLLDSDPLQSGYSVAKVADFGLSKKMYGDKNYEKENRTIIPWKWMAPELLMHDYLTLRSDVWSFGVLVWEMFSFGRAPYGQMGFEELMDKLENGYRLPCPPDLSCISTWSPSELYFCLSNACFKEEPEDRASFSDVVQILEKELTPTEKNLYQAMIDAYKNTNAKNYLEIGHRQNSYK